MSIHKVLTIENKEPCFAVPLQNILAELQRGGAIQTLSPLEYITAQQRKWYKGVCIRGLVKNDENGETEAWWDDEVKRKCNGLAYLKKEIAFLESTGGQKIPVGRLTTKGVGKKNMSLFMEEILSKSIMFGWDVSPPDVDLRK